MYNYYLDLKKQEEELQKKQNLIKSQEDKIKRKSNFLLIKDSLYRKKDQARDSPSGQANLSLAGENRNNVRRGSLPSKYGG